MDAGIETSLKQRDRFASPAVTYSAAAGRTNRMTDIRLPAKPRSIPVPSTEA